MTTLQPQSVLQQGRYIIQRVLGQGGFGITYEGVQAGLGRRVAIKEFFMKDYCERDGSDGHVTAATTGGLRDLVENFREKFVKEARLIASLDNAPHMVRIHDIFEENDTAYYVMQFVEGGSLQDLVRHQGVLSVERAVELICQTAEALDALHDQQTMHLDVKPSNILLRKDKLGRDDVVLIDFGVSKHYDKGGHQTTSTPVGISKGYAPLEQYREGGVSQFSPTADVYSLGATLYYLLTGQTPLEAADLLTESFDQPQGMSDAMWQIISKAMSVRPRDRYQTMAEMAADLRKTDFPEAEKGEQIPEETVVSPEISEETAIPDCQEETIVAPEPPIASVETVVSNRDNRQLHPVKNNGAWGFVDDEGVVVIPFEWDYAGVFNEGLALVRDDNDKYGFIDETGTEVIPCQWKEALSFSEGLSPVKDRNEKWGFINQSGEVVIRCEWEDAWAFSEGLALVEDINGKYGFIDKTGRLVIPCKWNFAWAFSNGLAEVQGDDDFSGFIDKTGQVVKTT